MLPEILSENRKMKTKFRYTHTPTCSTHASRSAYFLTYLRFSTPTQNRTVVKTPWRRVLSCKQQAAIKPHTPRALPSVSDSFSLNPLETIINHLLTPERMVGSLCYHKNRGYLHQSLVT